MGQASASVHVRASLAETWDGYFDPDGWRSWVDGFGAVDASAGYPEPGGTLRWRSVPAGRGVVEERVLEHQPRRRHRVRFADPESEGELVAEFAIEAAGTRVTLRTKYRLSRRGAFAAIADRLFIRGQVERSLARSLQRLKHEIEERTRSGAGAASDL